MRRREVLAAVTSGLTAVLSGCLGHSTDERDHFEIERPVRATADECVERELLDFERVYFPPAYLRSLGGDNAVQWSVELHEGEELYLRITTDPHAGVAYPPLLELTGPDGNVLLDSDDATENTHRINPDRDGRHTIWIGSRRTEEAEYFVDLRWYNAVDCSDPYSE